MCHIDHHSSSCSGEGVLDTELNMVVSSGGAKPRIEPVMDNTPQRGCYATNNKSQGEAMRPHFSQWPQTMCFQSDLSSGIALYALKDLNDAGRLKICSIQKSWLIGMEGAKGKQEFGRTASSAIQAFGRTATHVFRMVMLEACGVDPQNWPSGGETSYKNEDKLKYEQVMGPKFVLANSYEQAREFWSEFDKIYPHFLLERVMEEGGNLNKMMFIFKNFMQEVVEITMNVCAERSSGKHIRCCISCNVVHRHIDLEGAEGKWLDVLALAVRGTRHPMLAHFDRMLDLDTSMITDIQLQDTFNEIYNALPNEATEIDDTGNNSAAGKRLATVNESKPEHKAHSDIPKAAAKSNKEDKKQQIVETKTEKTVITTKTKTVTRDGKVVEQNEETKEVKLKSDPSSENIKTQPKPRNQLESAGQREVKIKTEPKANEEDENVNADEQPDLD